MVEHQLPKLRVASSSLVSRSKCKGMKTVLKILLVILVIVACLGFRSYYQSGAFKSVVNHFEGTTQKIEGVAGGEDLTIDQSTGIAFVSSMDRWSARKLSDVHGAIFRLNLNDSVLTLSNLTANINFEFNPHGISLFQSSEGKKILFVINHKHAGNYVEIFEYRNDSLIHRESISDPLMISPNDLVGVGERSFYFTNDHNEKASTFRMIKDLLGIGTGNVIYFDGVKGIKTDVTGVRYANGININNEGSELYLAATSGKEVYVFDRDASGTLSKVGEISCDTGVDNIEVDTENNLWIGCHPQLLKFLAHAKDEQKLSPSEIIRLTPTGKSQFKQETIYINDGSEISASSVAARFRNKLLIGPVFQSHLVVATMR